MKEDAITLMIAVGVLVFVVLAHTVFAQPASTLPVYLSQTTINYNSLSLANVELSSPSQMFVDIGNRFETTSIPVPLVAGMAYNIVGIQCDFVVGRRPIGAQSAMVFTWDASTIIGNAQAASSAQLRYDCGNFPCYQPFLSLNVTRAYKDTSYGWGWLYRCDFILNSGFNLLASSAPNNQIWVNFLFAIPNYDSTGGYQYKVMHPVIANSASVALYFQDPDNLLSHGWTNWTSGNVVTSFLYGNVANPMIGNRVAAYVVNASTLSSPGQTPPTPATSNSTVGMPTPGSNMSLPSSGPTSSGDPNDPVAPPTPTGPLSLWQAILIGIVTFLAAIILIIVFIVLVVRAIRRRCKWKQRIYDSSKGAFLNVEEEEEEGETTGLEMSSRGSQDDEDADGQGRISVARTVIHDDTRRSTTSHAFYGRDWRRDWPTLSRFLAMFGNSSDAPPSSPYMLSVPRGPPAPYEEAGVQVVGYASTVPSTEGDQL